MPVCIYDVGDTVVIDDDKIFLVAVKAELGVMVKAFVDIVGEVLVDDVELAWIY